MAKLGAKRERSGLGAAGILPAGLVCGAVVALATPYAMLAGVLFAPGLVLLLIDTAPGRRSTWPVLTIGAATLVHPMTALWAAGHQMSAAIALATDLRGLALAWAMQGLGWLGIELVPAIIRMGLEGSARARAVRLRHARAQIEEEWGIPPLTEEKGPPR